MYSYMQGATLCLAYQVGTFDFVCFVREYDVSPVP
jgi:hypothetical protein